MATRRHVVPNGSNGWSVKKAGSSRASSNHKTQADAERAAKTAARNTGGGEVTIHRPDGRIRDSDTIARPDPNPPKDTRH
jgi:hypothetical protein